MKKLWTVMAVVLLSGMATPLFCQDNVETANASRFVYCELVGTQKLFSTKVTVQVDYGEERRFFKDTRMRDEQTGKVQSFNSMVDALNYLGESGWEFVQAYVVTVGQQNVYHWLLKKEK